jgi:hypothetical protein
MAGGFAGKERPRLAAGHANRGEILASASAAAFRQDDDRFSDLRVEMAQQSEVSCVP